MCQSKKSEAKVFISILHVEIVNEVLDRQWSRNKELCD